VWSTKPGGLLQCAILKTPVFVPTVSLKLPRSLEAINIGFVAIDYSGVRGNLVFLPLLHPRNSPTSALLRRIFFSQRMLSLARSGVHQWHLEALMEVEGENSTDFGVKFGNQESHHVNKLICPPKKMEEKSEFLPLLLVRHILGSMFRTFNLGWSGVWKSKVSWRQR